MKKIVLIALAAVAVVGCKGKVKPVEEALNFPTLYDSIVVVDGLGDIVTDIFVKEIAANAEENVPAQTQVLKLHHQAQAKNGVFEMKVTVEGVAEPTVETGKFNVVEGGEFPIYELTSYGENTTTFFWALKGDIFELLDADKLPLATPFTLTRIIVAPGSDVAEAVEEVVEEVATEETAA